MIQILRFSSICLIFLCWIGLACNASEGTTDEALRVRVSNIAYQKMYGDARILTGDIENLSDERISVAQIDVSLYDPGNRKVESLMILVRDIESGATVSFREPVRSKFDIRSAKARAVFLP